MKVKHLIEILSKLDPELDVGYMHNSGVLYADSVGVYEGLFHGPNGNKMTYKTSKQKYLLIGNPGNFEELAYHDVNTPKHTFDVFQDGIIEEDTWEND